MTVIVLVTPSEELEQRVTAAVGAAVLTLPADPVPADPAQLFRQLGGAPTPEVVVLDAGSGSSDAALLLATRLDLQCPGISVVLISEQPDHIGLAAMRAGVRDVLHPTAEHADIRTVLERAGRAAARSAVDALAAGADSPGDVAPTGRVISVVSPKGGVGKTTVATNLAVGLAGAAPHATVLVDLDLQFGDVANALNLTPEYTLPDAVQGAAATDTMVLKTFLTQHETGLYVLCGADSPAEADAVSGEAVARLLRMLASEFRFVVVDTAPGLSEHTLAVLDQTTDPILLTSMDVPGVRGLRKELDVLDQLGMCPAGRHVVLNFADPRGGLTVGDVEATIGTGVDLQLPRSKAAPGSVNTGVPLLQSGGRDPLTKQLRRLVERIAPTVAGPARAARPGRAGRASRRQGRHRAMAGVS